MTWRIEKIFWDGPLCVTHPEGFISAIYLQGVIRSGIDVVVTKRLMSETTTECSPELLSDAVLCEECRQSELRSGIAIRVGVLRHLSDYFWSIAKVLGCFALLEQDIVDEVSVETANRLYDLIVCPSSYVQSILRESGVTKRTHVWLPGVEPWAHQQAKQAGGRYRFGWIGHGEVEGMDLAITAFQAAFGDNVPADLIICDLSRDAHKQECIEKDPRLLVLPSSWPSILEFYTSIDCLVRPCRHTNCAWFEVQALAQGIPVIVTGYGSVLDICNDMNAHLVDIHRFRRLIPFVTALEAGYRRPPLCVEPDLEHLIQLYRKVLGAPRGMPKHELPTWGGQFKALLNRAEELTQSGVFMDIEW